MKYLVTGCAGFIGSHMVDRLLGEGHSVIGVDNLSTGRREFIVQSKSNPRFRLAQTDLTTANALDGVIAPDVDWVIHLAANADVRDGFKHPTKDIEQNILATLYVLEAMRKVGVRKIAFSSTGSVYGDTAVIPSPENCPFPLQTSLYGTSKLSAEGLISAYAEGCGFQGLIFRFVSILGERYTHGHVLDFVRQLRKNSHALSILGDGKQRKSYLYVGDCIEAIMQALHRSWKDRVEVLNLGTDEFVNVDQSVDIICQEMKVKPQRTYTGGDRGWPGDNPYIFLDCAKMRVIGWRPTKSIREAVTITTRYLLENPWIFDERKAL
jgi:UDP-glucose 4-epimerase